MSLCRPDFLLRNIESVEDVAITMKVRCLSALEVQNFKTTATTTECGLLFSFLAKLDTDVCPFRNHSSFLQLTVRSFMEVKQTLQCKTRSGQQRLGRGGSCTFFFSFYFLIVSFRRISFILIAM